MERKNWHLKYRPFQLEDIVGQSSVVNTLKQASKFDKFANSYFLVGIKGGGKTSTARILANLLTCENPENGKLCGKCLACKSIPNDMAMDVIELDGAANGKVENISQLIEGAKWSPTQLKRKVYIIDECHRLSGGAVSALLKITEEPPEYLTFIFCTTDPDKVIDTIPSRSQRFNFRRIMSKEMVSRLRYISDKESVNITDEALFVLAKNSKGSMRDAIVSLEQIATVAGGQEISGDKAQKYFGNANRHITLQIIKSMINQDISLLMDQVNDLIVSNVNCKEIAFEVSEALRNIMLLAINEGNQWIDLPDSETILLKEYGKSLNLQMLNRLSKCFSTLHKELSYSINERWILESTFISCIALIKSSK
jgi:DNA polymerase III subunit gamma/tau